MCCWALSTWENSEFVVTSFEILPYLRVYKEIWTLAFCDLLCVCYTLFQCHREKFQILTINVSLRKYLYSRYRKTPVTKTPRVTSEQLNYHKIITMINITKEVEDMKTSIQKNRRGFFQNVPGQVVQNYLEVNDLIDVHYAYPLWKSLYQGDSNKDVLFEIGWKY